MASGYLYRGGPWELGTKASTTTTAIAPLDAVVLSSGKLIVLTTGVKADGVSLETKTLADTATTAIQFIRVFDGRTKWLAYVKAGTLATTEDGSFLDLSGTTGAMGISADVTTHDDFFIDSVIVASSSGSAIVKFADASYLNPVNA